MRKETRNCSKVALLCATLLLPPAYAQFSIPIPIPIPSFGGGGKRQLPPYYVLCTEADKLRKAGDLKGAADKYQQAVALEPNKAGARVNLGRLLDDLGRPHEAIIQLETALAIEPTDTIAYVNLIAAYISASRLADAIAVGKAFQTRFPRNKLQATIDAEVKSAQKELDRRQQANKSYGLANGMTNQPQGSNYFALTTDHGLLRWSFARMPLKVYIPSGKQGKYVRPEYATVFTNAFKEWQTATGGNVSFVFIDEPGAADITVFWNDDYKHVSEALELGEARFDKMKSEHEIDHITISMLTHNTMVGSTLDPEQVYSVGLHEIGHALGLHGHSDNPKDIMYFTKNSRSTHVSERDVNTLKMIYVAQLPSSSVPTVAINSSLSEVPAGGGVGVDNGMQPQGGYAPQQVPQNNYAPQQVPQNNYAQQSLTNNAAQQNPIAYAPAPPNYVPSTAGGYGTQPNLGTAINQSPLNDGFSQPTPVLKKHSGLEPYIDQRLNNASPADAIRYMEAEASSRPQDLAALLDLSVAYNNRATEILNTSANVSESERLFRQALNLQSNDRARQMVTLQNLCHLLEMTDRMQESAQLKANYGSRW